MPGRHNLQNALAAVAVAWSSACRSSARGGAARSSAARNAVRGARRGGRRAGRRRLRSPPDGDRGGARGRARALGRRLRRGVPASPVLAARGRCSRRSARRSPARTRSCSPTSTRRARSRFPGITVEALAEPVRLDVRRAGPVVRQLDGRAAAVARIARPGDAVITLGAGSIGTATRASPTPCGAARGAGGGREKRGCASHRACRSAVPARARQARAAPRAVARLVRAARSRSSLAAALALAGMARAHARRRLRRAARAARLPWSGNQRLSTGEVLALVDGLRGRTSFRSDLEQWRGRVLDCPWVARRGSEAGAARRRSRSSSPSASRSPSGASATSCTWWTSRARSSTSSARSTRTSTCRSSTGWPAGDRRRRRTSGGRPSRRACWTRCGAEPDLARASRRWTSRTRTTRWSSGRGPGAAAARRRAVPRAAQVVPRAGAALRERVPEIDYVDLRFGDRVYVRPASRSGRLARSGRGTRVTAAERRRPASGRTRRESGAQRTIPGRARRRHVEGRRPSSASCVDDGGLDIVGMGVAESHGIRRGLVVNLEAAVDSIKKAIEEAELTAGIEIDNVLPRPVGAAREGVQQPRRRGGRGQEPRDHARGRAARHRRRQGRVAAGRPRDPPRAAAGLRGGRPGRHRRPGRA